MPEQKQLSFREQKALKLKIEDEIPRFLDGGMMQSALNFAIMCPSGISIPANRKSPA